VTCAGCGSDLGPLPAIGRRDACPRCGADLHACRQCRVHEPRLANECREPQAERVDDRTRGNFCDFFAPRGDPRPGDVSGDAAPASRAALDRLFQRR